MESNNFADALVDTRLAVDKVKHQQKYQKISTDVKDTLNRLLDELSKVVAEGEYQTLPSRANETTDL